MVGESRRRLAKAGSKSAVKNKGKFVRKVNDGILEQKKTEDQKKGSESESNSDPEGAVTGGEESSVGESESERVEIQTWRKAGRKGRKPKQVSYTCRGGITACNKPIVSGEASIQCECCDDWFHPKCQGIEKKAFEAIDAHDLFWMCKQCIADMKERKNIGNQVKLNMDRAEAHIVKKVDEVKDLLEKVIEKKVDEGLKKMELKIGESSKVIKKAVQEKNIDRSKNLIFHNIPEGDSLEYKDRQEHDRKMLLEMIGGLCGKDEQVKISQIFRLQRRQSQEAGEQDRRPRLLLVKFEKEESAEMLMRSRFGLREIGFPNIFITKDLSKEERERQWKLREELRRKGSDTHKIFQGRVVPRTE